jgi:hypothetical protein
LEALHGFVVLLLDLREHGSEGRTGRALLRGRRERESRGAGRDAVKEMSSVHGAEVISFPNSVFRSGTDEGRRSTDYFS